MNVFWLKLKIPSQLVALQHGLSLIIRVFLFITSCLSPHLNEKVDRKMRRQSSSFSSSAFIWCLFLFPTTLVLVLYLSTIPSSELLKDLFMIRTCEVTFMTHSSLSLWIEFLSIFSLILICGHINGTSW